MHLKSYPKLVRSELRLDVVGVQTSQRSQQQAALLRTCSGNRGNNIISGSNRLPFSVLSPNTLRCSAVTNIWLPGCENDSLRLYQTAAEDGDAPPDIWTVIKPGHVREKIAIFASDDECTGSGGSHRSSTNGGSSTNHAAMSGLSRATKAKGSREDNCSAKRRRRSGNEQQDTHKASSQRSDSASEALVAVTAAEEQKVSVVEMVAFLEQRASEPQQQPDAKPLLALQRSSASITLSRATPPEVRGEEPESGRGEEPESIRGEEPESVRGEEPESVRVSDMVARLESACVKRQSAGDLSRNNSLRRMVGRVLLATATDQSSAPCPPSPASSITSSSDSEPTGCSETAVSAVANANGSFGDEMLDAATETHTQAPPLTQPPPAPKVEPLPGLLFLLPASQPRPPAARCDSGSQSEKRRRRRKADRAQQQGMVQDADAGVVTLCSSSSPPRRASPDFLLMRQRLQQLLAPQPFLAVLPHHVLLTILALLPTQSLAALKCTCRYLRSVIDDYGVRPADSLWVSDPRYRDDPCKQCKKRYGRGDVSLCRWHHKPYCQALPYGPGYWMCCRGARRDTPGCNVGLHDNRWVPAFHSINVPIYRRGRSDD